MKEIGLKIAIGILAFAIGITFSAVGFIYPYSVTVFLAGITGVLAACSAQIGRKVWAPKVFAWRNPFKLQPIIEEQADCPLHLARPRFYSFMAIGSSISSVLKVDAKNVNNKAIDSFFISYHSPMWTHTSGMGIEPKKLLKPKQSETIGTSFANNERITFSVDFVQFADGGVWFANPSGESVKPEGVQAGEQAATEYLQEVLEVDGAEAVMHVLPNIKSKMGLWKFSEKGDCGIFGFNYGIKKAVLGVRYAHEINGLSGVEDFLMKQHQ